MEDPPMEEEEAGVLEETPTGKEEATTVLPQANRRR